MEEQVKKLKILVVDDDVNLRRIQRLFLQNANYDVIEAKDGRESLVKAQQELPDLIIMDAMMPVMDGFTACTELRKLEATQDTPIVMCTAKSGKEDIINAVKSGANDYLIKPFTRESLLTKVAKFTTQVKVKDETVVIDRRRSQRASVRWNVSWGIMSDGKSDPLYVSYALNINTIGLAIEFKRCNICTGYEKDSIHQQCLLARFGERFGNSQDIDMILYLTKDLFTEAKGKIVYIYQSPDKPTVETIGIKFTNLPVEGRRFIWKYTEGKAPIEV